MRLLAGAAMPEVDEVHVAVPGVMEIVPDGGDPMAIVRWTTACVMTSRASWGLLRRRQRWEKKCVVIGAPLMFQLQGSIGLGSMSVEWKGLGALGGRRAEADARSEHNIHYAQWRIGLWRLLFSEEDVYLSVFLILVLLTELPNLYFSAK